MAKTPKLKSKPSSSSNPRSRASKRATSPSINLDKSLLIRPIPATSRNNSSTAPVLAARPGAGVTKQKSAKSKRGNAKSRGQLKRRERGLQRAEAVMEKREKKVDEARGREGKLRERRKVWEEINGGVNVGGGVGKVAGKGADWEDVEGGDEMDADEMGENGDVPVPVPVESALMATESMEPRPVVGTEGDEVVGMDHGASLNGAEVEVEVEVEDEDEVDKIT